MSSVETRTLDQIKFRPDLYPRFEPDASAIQRYAQNLDGLPPVEVNQHDELIDGFHRWSAHRQEKAAAIRVVVTPTGSDAEFMRLAIGRNAAHGLQLRSEEKKEWAVKLYTTGAMRDAVELATVFAVSRRQVDLWLNKAKRTERASQMRRIKDLWLACYTLDEIAESVSVPIATVAKKTALFLNLEILRNREIVADFDGDADDSDSVVDEESGTVWDSKQVTAAKYLDSDPVLYDLWKWKRTSNTVSHFGQTNVEIVDNLLRKYTQPFQIVVDPFAGGGSTIDVCRRRLRRYWVADRVVKAGMEGLIRQGDIKDGPPALNRRWSEVGLLYLDPPYWRQAAGQYSDDDDDLGNMDLEAFYAALVGYVKASADKMPAGSRIALIIQPTQWLADDRRLVDHVVDLILRVGNKRVRYERRVLCPYEPEQYNAQQVEWAKANNEWLTLDRELIVWEVVK